MPLDWRHETYRRLYTAERGSFARLPVLCRGLAAELTKVCNDEGWIDCGSEDPAVVVCRMLGAHRGERRLIKKFIPLLIKDGFLVGKPQGILVRNLVAANERRTDRQRSDNEAATKPEVTQQNYSTPSGDSARVPRKSPPTTPKNQERQRSDNEAATKPEVTQQNYSTPSGDSARVPRKEIAAPVEPTEGPPRQRSDNEAATNGQRTSNETGGNPAESDKSGRAMPSFLPEEERTEAPIAPNSVVEKPSAVSTWDGLVAGEPTKAKGRKSSKVIPASPEVWDVFKYWQEVQNHPKAILDGNRVKIVQKAIARGHSVADLKLAIDGCKLSPLHQGENDRRTVYDDIELICRDAKHVEMFMSLAKPSGGLEPQGENLAATGMGQEEAGKVDRHGGEEGGSEGGLEPPGKAPSAPSEEIEVEPALQAVFDGSAGKMRPWGTTQRTPLSVDLKRRLNALVPQGLTLDDLRAFGQWIAQGGPDGIGGFSWMTSETPTWQWLLAKPGRLEGYLAKASAWAQWKKENEHRFRCPPIPKRETQEEREARFARNREAKAKNPRLMAGVGKPATVEDPKRLDTLPTSQPRPNPFAAHQQALLEETQRRCGTKEEADKERS